MVLEFRVIIIMPLLKIKNIIKNIQFTLIEDRILENSGHLGYKV